MESTSLTKALGLLEATAGHTDGRRLIDLVQKTAIAISARLKPSPVRKSPRKESR